MIDVKQVSYAVRSKSLVHDASLRVCTGELVVIMGANGAGKSTLLKMIAGSLRQQKGEIVLDDLPLHQYTTESLARKRAVLSQQYHIEFPMTVREIVMMGRYPYFGSHPQPQDELIVDEMMCRMEIKQLASRNYQTLSGGEAQKVQMSRVLAQIGNTSVSEGKALLLDEPVSHLDIKYQHQLLQVAKSLCQHHVAVLAVLHDINLALKYADRILFMKQGEMKTSINPAGISAELLQDIFDVNAFVTDTPHGKLIAY